MDGAGGGGGDARVSRRHLLAGGTAVAMGGLFWIGAPQAPAQNASAQRLQVDIQPTGLPQAELDFIVRGLHRSPAMRSAIGFRNRRVINIREVDAEEAGKTAAGRAGRARRWRAVLYDYDLQRAFVAEGRLGDPTPERLQPIAGQPIPAPDEWAEARDRLRSHPQIGPGLRSGGLIAYRPMPPVLVSGAGRRMITVGLLPVNPAFGLGHEILAVDLGSGAVQRYAARAPATALAGQAALCGAPPDSNQPITGQGEAGQYTITIRRDGVVIWRFTAVRPSASSGLRGSGIELRQVYYRGRQVLHRAHLPILNVKYDGDACGPFRDWQYAEGMLQATGREVAPGFIRASSPPTTIIQSGNDTGSYLGTAIWVSGEEVTLMAEMEAGWYRYISQWTFHTNGIIKPRFGFAGVSNRCICNVHHHHAYWRLDFDIGTAGDQVVQELGDAGWRTLPTETAASRDPAFKRRWRVLSTSLRRGYEIRPNPSDGRAQDAPDWPFGAGDLWFLRFYPGEIDDGVNTTTGDVTAKLDQFVDGESLAKTDIVVWYASHFTHDQAEEEAGGHSYLVGPNLVPVNW